MMTPDESRSWLRNQLMALGLSVTELARLSHVHKATIHRALNEGYEFTPSGRTMEKLSTAIVAYAASKGIHDISTRDFSMSGDQFPDQVGYDGPVGVGFRDLSLWQQRPSQIAYSPRISRDLQSAFMIGDESANEVFEFGDYIHVIASPILDVIQTQVDDLMVISRESPETGLTEIRVYQVCSLDGDTLNVRAPTTVRDLESKEVLPLHRKVTRLDTQISVFGIIIGSYRPRHFLGT